MSNRRKQLNFKITHLTTTTKLIIWLQIRAQRDTRIGYNEWGYMSLGSFESDQRTGSRQVPG